MSNNQFVYFYPIIDRNLFKLNMSNSQLVYFYRDFLNENANISIRDRNQMCGLAYSFRNEKFLIFTLFILALVSLFTLIMLYVVYKNKEVRRIFSLTHIDLKFILVVGFSNYIVMTLNSLIFFLYQMSILLIDLSPCSYITSGFFCVHIQKLCVSICPVVSNYVFFAMFLERCYISFGFKSKGTFGFLLALIISVTTISAYFIQYEAKYYDYDRVFCSSILTLYDENVNYVIYATVTFEFTISILDFGLLLFNKWRIRAYK
jgi:hypothetical protein